MKTILKPVRDRCVEAGFTAVGDFLIVALNQDFDMVVQFQTSKFGLPKGRYYLDAEVGIRWKQLTFELERLTGSPSRGGGVAIGKLLSMIVGPSSHYEWVLPGETTEVEFTRALVNEGTTWAKTSADPHFIAQELELYVRGGYGLPIRWPISVLLTHGPEAAAESARATIEMLERSSGPHGDPEEIALLERFIARLSES